MTHQNCNAKHVRRRHVLILPLIEQHREKIERHLSRYEVDENGCWNWTGRIIKQGDEYSPPYGAISLTKNTKLFIHRLAYAYHTGAEPGALVVRHMCDNTLCMNPDHLTTGTHDENMRDRQARGRTARGRQIKDGQLTERDIMTVLSMLGRHGDDEIASAIGRRIQPVTIRNLRRGKTWSHITGIGRAA